MNMMECRDYNPGDYINPKPRGFFASLFRNHARDITRVESEMCPLKSDDGQRKLIALKRLVGTWDVFEVLKTSDAGDDGHEGDAVYAISLRHRAVAGDVMLAEIKKFNDNLPSKKLGRELVRRREEKLQKENRERSLFQTFRF